MRIYSTAKHILVPLKYHPQGGTCFPYPPPGHHATDFDVINV